MGLFEDVCVMFERAMFPDVFGHGNRAAEGLSLQSPCVVEYLT